MRPHLQDRDAGALERDLLALGEIAGDVAITFNPEDAGAIADALLKLVSEQEQDRKDRIARGREWIKRYSWADHAAGLVKLLEGVS